MAARLCVTRGRGGNRIACAYSGPSEPEYALASFHLLAHILVGEPVAISPGYALKSVRD
jgi:hypothetical protein